MKINRNNFESYFIDYLDQKLTFTESRELYAFLLLNDDLREQLDDLEEIKLKAIPVEYPHKSILKKDELQECPDYYAIAMAENALTQSDVIFLNKHTEYQELTSVYKKLKLKTNPNIRFSKKSHLYRPVKAARLIRFSLIGAAIVCLFLGITHLIQPVTDCRNTYVQIPTSLIIPDAPDTELADLSILTATKNEIFPNKKKQTRIFTEYAENKTCRDELSIMQINTLPAIVKVPEVTLAYELISNYPAYFTFQSEIYLAESASIWKSSERNIFSDNIFNTMIQAGKLLAEKLKIKTDQE